MPIYLDTPETEMRATTNRVMAAVEGVLGWMLGRQHEADLRWSLGVCQPEALRERTGEGSVQC